MVRTVLRFSLASLSSVPRLIVFADLTATLLLRNGQPPFLGEQLRKIEAPAGAPPMLSLEKRVKLRPKTTVVETVGCRTGSGAGVAAGCGFPAGPAFAGGGLFWGGLSCGGGGLAATPPARMVIAPAGGA